MPLSVTTLSTEVGNIMCSKPIWELPAFVAIIGCNSSGYGEPEYSGVSRLWAFEFDDNDYVNPTLTDELIAYTIKYLQR